jgi:hypothetical protein
MVPPDTRRKLLDFFISKRKSRSRKKKKKTKKKDKSGSNHDDCQADGGDDDSDYVPSSGECESDTEVDEEECPTKKGNKSLDPTALRPFLDVTIGMRIVTTRNECSEGGYTNGSLGTIVGIMYDKNYDDDLIHVTKDQAAARPPPLPILLVKFDRYDGPGYAGMEKVFPIQAVFQTIYNSGGSGYFRRLMFPVLPGKAVTIHKSQGGSYPDIVVDPRYIFAPGQA